MTEYSRMKFRFRLEIGGLSVGGFSEVSGFDGAIEPIEYRQEDMAVKTPLKAAGLRKYGNITLKKGIVNGQVLYDWMAPGLDQSVQRKNVTVSLLDEKQNTAASWQVMNAWPTKCTPPDFNAASNEVAVETLELAHAGIVKQL